MGDIKPDSVPPLNTPTPRRDRKIVLLDLSHEDDDDEDEDDEDVEETRNGTHSGSSPSRTAASASPSVVAAAVKSVRSAVSCSVTDHAYTRSSPGSGYVTYKCSVQFASRQHPSTGHKKTSRSGSDIGSGSGSGSKSVRATHSIRKRYSEFVVLRRHLRRRFPDTYIPKLPIKSYSPRQTSDFKFLEDRQSSLELFLRGVVLHPDLGSCDIVADWLELS